LRCSARQSLARGPGASPARRHAQDHSAKEISRCFWRYAGGLRPGALIYLDHNATTPVLPEVFEAMRLYFREEWGNASSYYTFGSDLKGVIEMAREGRSRN
jgi:hypothetical protein